MYAKTDQCHHRSMFAKRLTIVALSHRVSMTAAKIITSVAPKHHASRCRHLSMYAKTDRHPSMFAKRLAIVVFAHRVSMMTAKRLAIIDPNHHASMNITKRLAIIAQDRQASVIIAMRYAIIDIIKIVANREDIMIIIRLVITGSYHQSNMSARTAAVVK